MSESDTFVLLMAVTVKAPLASFFDLLFTIELLYFEPSLRYIYIENLIIYSYVIKK